MADIASDFEAFRSEKATSIADDFEAFKKEQKTPKQEQGFVSGMVDAAVSGVKSTVRNIGAFGNAVTGDYKSVEDKSVDAQDAEAKSPEAKKAFLADVQSRKAANPDQDAWGAIKDVGSAALDNKEGVAQFVVEQAPNSAVSLGGAWAGAKTGAAIGSKINPVYGTAVGGALGFLGGMFMGNWALEGGGEAISKAEGGLTKNEADEAVAGTARKAGVITAVDAATFKLGGVAAKAINNPAIRAGARAEAKSLADAGVDITNIAAINAALANPVIRKAAEEAGELAAKQASSIGKKAASAGIQVAGETFGEGAGEYLGELAKDGEADAYDAVLESLAGLTMSVPEAAYNINEARGNNLDAKGIQGSGPFEPTDQPVTPTTPVVEPTVETGFTPEEVAAFKAEQAANQATMQRDLDIQRGMAEVNAGNDILPVEDEQVIAPAKSYAQQQEDAANQFLANQQPESYLQWAQSVDLGDLILSAPNNVAKEALTVSEILSGPYDVAVKEQAAARLWSITQSARIQTPDTLPEDAGILTKLAAIGTQTGAVPLNKWGFHQQPVVADVAIDPSAETVPVDSQPIVDDQTVENSGGYEAAAVGAANQWDTDNRTSRADRWFEGAHVTQEARDGFTEALNNGGSSLSAHGMAKETTLTGGIKNLLGLLTNGLDMTRRNGVLDTAPLVSNPGEGLVGATASGSAYSDGPFILVARPGEQLAGNLSGLGAILINQEHADIAQQIADAIHSIRPDVIVETYSGAGRVAQELNANQASTTPATPIPESGANQPVTQAVPASLPVESAAQGTPVSRALLHTRDFLAKFKDSSKRDRVAQEKFTAAAEKQFGIANIAGYKGGFTVQVADRDDGNATVYMQGPSGAFLEAGTVPLTDTPVYQPAGEPVAPQPEQVVTQEGESQSQQGTPEPVAFSYDTKYTSKAQAEMAMRAAKQAAKRGENVGIHPQAVVKSTGTEFWIGSPTENTKRENAKESTDLIQRIKANGGIKNGVFAEELSGEKNGNSVRVGLFSENGKELDDLFTDAGIEKDFPNIKDSNDLANAIRLALAQGEKQLSYEGIEAKAEALIKKRADDAFAEQAELESELSRIDEEHARLEREAMQDEGGEAEVELFTNEIPDHLFDATESTADIDDIFGVQNEPEQSGEKVEDTGAEEQGSETVSGSTETRKTNDDAGTQTPETVEGTEGVSGEVDARTLDEDGRASDGNPIKAGDVFATLSGRKTTPFQKQKSERYASQWLIDNAVAEAESRGDNFNAGIFKNTSAMKKGGELTPADRQSMLMYLFSEQPAVVPSIFKPLTQQPVEVTRKSGQEGNTEAAVAAFDELLKTKNMATYHELGTEKAKREYREGFYAGYNGERHPEGAIKSRAMDEGWLLGRRSADPIKRDENGNVVVTPPDDTKTDEVSTPEEAKADETPDLELTGETPEELKAKDDARIEREKQLAADAKKAEAAEREAAIEKERQSRADIAADEFSLDPTESSQDDQKKADKAKADDQFAGQGGLFGGEQAQPVEKREPATLTIDDIPAGFMINFKVSLPVINTVTNVYEAGEAGAEDALNETRSDIKKMKDLLGCLQG